MAAGALAYRSKPAGPRAGTGLVYASPLLSAAPCGSAALNARSSSPSNASARPIPAHKLKADKEKENVLYLQSLLQQAHVENAELKRQLLLLRSELRLKAIDNPEEAAECEAAEMSAGLDAAILRLDDKADCISRT